MSTSIEEAVVTGEKHMLSIPDHTGDTRIMWDPRVPEEVELAKKSFKAARDKGMIAYGVAADGSSNGEVIREFDKDMSKVIMVKQLVGG